jgi:hypothetical protein
VSFRHGHKDENWNLSQEWYQGLHTPDISFIYCTLSELKVNDYSNVDITPTNTNTYLQELIKLNTLRTYYERVTLGA